MIYDDCDDDHSIIHSMTDLASLWASIMLSAVDVHALFRSTQRSANLRPPLQPSAIR